MFESITKKRKKRWINYFGWALLGLCCLVFVFLMDFDQSLLGNTGAAAEVNGEAISYKSFVELVERMEENSKSSSPEDTKRIRQNAINMLVNQQLVLQKSKELNIYVSDDEVAQTLMDIGGFQDEGRFSRVRYKTYLRNTRQSEEQFELMIRKMLLERKILGLVKHVADEIPLVEEIDKQLGQAQINISYLAFNKYSASTVSQPKPEDIDKFSSDQAEKVKAYYNDNKSEFFDKEQVKARHILIKFDAKKEGEEAKARAKAEKIKSELTVSNFSEMAKKHSEDPGSKVKGGDLGFFGRGRMVPPFEKYAFSGEIGKISDLVTSDFGFHIIIVDEKKSARQKGFEEVSRGIATNLLREERFNTLAESVEKTLKASDMAQLEVIAKENGVKWKDTGLFSINEEFIPGVGRVREFMDGAMRLTADKPVSKNLVRHEKNRYVMKLKEAKIQEKKVSPQNLQMDFFKQMMARQRANLVMQSWIDTLKKTSKISINPNITQ